MQGSSLFFMEMGMSDKTRSQCLEILTHRLTLYRRILVSLILCCYSIYGLCHYRKKAEVVADFLDKPQEIIDIAAARNECERAKLLSIVSKDNQKEKILNDGNMP